MKYRYGYGERPLDGYTIRRGVGQGGFGEVYYAVSDGGREVALKSILRNEEIELRGVRECINLKSPQLVSIFDVRTADDGTAFVIMEYVTGPSLRVLLNDHPEGLGDEEVAYLLREIAQGLKYLHERMVVHRDLKPENIFYEDGRAKIGDYGLAKLINASQQSGQTMSVGTVHYMAPEIGSGNYHRGIDIYALGIILYELLTGRVPFRGDSIGEILMKHLTKAPDLSCLAEPFRSVVAGALAKDPKDRFQTIDDLMRPLQGGALEVSLATCHPRSLSEAAQRYHRADDLEEAPTGTETSPAEAPAQVPRMPTRVRERDWAIGVFGAAERKGRWVPARATRVIACMGGADLDFREAVLAPGVSDLQAYCVMGGVTIIVPPDLQIEFEGNGIMGGFDCDPGVASAVDPDRPVLRIGGVAFMGGVTVTARLPGENAGQARRRKALARKATRASGKRRCWWRRAPLPEPNEGKGAES